MSIELLKGDCMEAMKSIPEGSVDFVLCDPPFGMTAGKWDAPLPFWDLWELYGRVCKPNATICLFACQPFTTHLISTNLSNFRYCWYWIKNQATNFFHASEMPLRKVEEICVFGNKDGLYFPQYKEGCEPTRRAVGCSNGRCYHGDNTRNYEGGSTLRFPTNVLDFKCVDNYSREHPNEKPVELLSYLIRTYTCEGDTVLDNCMGSGSTGIACLECNRNFIGIEKEDKYFAIAESRIGEKREHGIQTKLF